MFERLYLLFVQSLHISPAHYCAQMYCMYLGLKSPSGAGSHIETSRQGALCEHTKRLTSRNYNISPPVLKLHPRGNTA